MNIQTHNDADIDLNMTSLEGYIRGTRRALTAAFGEPMLDADEDSKTNCEWHLRITDGSTVTVASIYSWKEGRIVDLDEVISFHIGGHNKQAVTVVHEAFRAKQGLGCAPISAAA